MIKLTINGKAIEIEEGATIMEAAAGVKKAGAQFLREPASKSRASVT